MGFLDSLLGGGSEEVVLPEYLQEGGEFIGNRINSILKRPGQKNFNPFQQEGIGGLVETARAGNPFLGGNTNFLTSLFSGGGLGGAETGLATGLTGGGFINPAFAEASRIAGGGELGQNPFLESQFNRAANVVGENFNQNIIPGMDNEFAAAGRSGSKRYASERNTAEDAYGRQINDLANQVYGGAYESDLGRRDQALGQVGQLGQQDVSNRLSGAGLFQQGRQNLFSGIDASGAVDAMRYADPTRLYEAGNLIQQQPFQSLQTGANILGSLNSPQQTIQNPNPFSQLANLGITAGALFAGSDAGLKEDIERVGTLLSGLPLYRFRYRGEDEPQVGVLAHEAVALFPEAVAMRDDGWLAVDYARIG